MENSIRGEFMRTRFMIFGICLLAAILVNSCTKTTPTGGGTNTQTSTIFGYVQRSDNLTKVPNVVVYDVGGMAKPDTTKPDGSFKLTFALTAVYSATIVAHRTTFGDDTLKNFQLNAGANDTLPRILTLIADSTSQKTAAASGKVASIVLVAGGDVTTIAIRGTGFTESTPLTFEARDSNGVAVGGINQAKIYFALLGGPVGGGQYVFPTSALTDLSGRVVTRISSGSKPGVVQVYSYAIPDSTKPNVIVTSSPIRLVISGGLPDASHFSMSVQKLNIAGISYDNLRDGVSVIVGDKSGNPVQIGTAVYFNTTGGIIQPSAQTSVDGLASVSLISANPRPANGQVFVTATTIGDSGAIISRTNKIIFSGTPVIIGPASNFQIVDSGSYNFVFKVSDANGNPLSSGASIAVTKDGPGSNDLDLKGDVTKNMTDTQDTTLTIFRVQVQDKSRGGAAGLVTFTISVTGDNGTASYTWTGTQLAEGVSPIGASTGIAASIQLVGTSANTVSVRGTGASETAVITWLVKDSLGNPITAPNSVPLQFDYFPKPGGGEYLFPTTAITDAYGRASTTLSGGTKSSVVQVVAKTVLSTGQTVQSAPVPMTIASGLADPAHTTMWSTLNVVNYPLLATPGTTFADVIHVQLGDRYGNPAQPTAVYFSTNAGLITASGYSSILNPIANASLISGPPSPIGGIDTITAITQGENPQLPIKMFVIFTASGFAKIFAPASIPNITSGGFGDLYFDVKDANGNPLAAGNAITVTLSGSGAALLTMSGDNNVTTIDTRDTASVHFHVKLSNAGGGGTGGTFAATISVSGPNGSVKPSIVTGFVQAQGSLGAGPGGGTGYTSSIVLGSVSATDISVQGTGNNETATLVFQSRDSLGQNVDQAHGSMIHFVISAPTLGAILTIDSMQMDAAGRATTLIRSGTVSGVIQVQASTTVPSGQTIASLPVRISINSGLPDQAHFTIGPQKFNFPGLDFNGLTDGITVQMGDKFGNPVQAGTVAYFTSDHGIIQTTASTTSSDGFISKLLYSANPRPEPPYAISAGNGWSYVTVTTFGSAGQVVTDSIKLLWTGAPIITKTGGPSGFSIPKGGSVGPYTFTVVDRFNHPMTSGTSITASANNGVVTGNVGVTLPDVIGGGAGITSFSIVLANSDQVGGTNPPVASQLIVTVSHPVYGTFSLILDSGTMQ
jgi:hypothetical protein